MGSVAHHRTIRFQFFGNDGLMMATLVMLLVIFLQTVLLLLLLNE